MVREDLVAPAGQGGNGGGGKHGGGQHGRSDQRERKTAGGGWRNWRGKGKARGKLASAWVEEMGGYLSVPEVEISGTEEFMEAFVNKSRPAVIKVTRGTRVSWGRGYIHTRVLSASLKFVLCWVFLH